MLNRALAPELQTIKHIDFLKPRVFDVSPNVRLYWNENVPNDTSRVDLYFDAGTILGTILTIGSDPSQWGSFTGKVTTDSRSTVGLGQSRTIIITGNFKPGTDGYYGAITALEDGVLILTFSKATAGGSVTSSWALDTVVSNSPAVPEPTSVAIFSLGAVGFAVRRFRRK